jgi:hypothetical protein
MSNARYPRKSALIEDHNRAAAKSLAKQRGQCYYARAKWFFDIGRYHAAAWLCRAGLRLSTGPFMLAVRDQLHELAAGCDRHLGVTGLKDARYLCSIEITAPGRTGKQYLATLTVDELVELELRLVTCTNDGNVEKFLISPREPVENLNYLLHWMNFGLIGSRLAGHNAEEPRSSVGRSVLFQIDHAAQYQDGLITFPAFMYESLKEELGVPFEPAYLATNPGDTATPPRPKDRISGEQ